MNRITATASSTSPSGSVPRNNPPSSNSKTQRFGMDQLTSFTPTFSFVLPPPNKIPGQDPSIDSSSGATTMDQLTSFTPEFSFSVLIANRIPGQDPSTNLNSGTTGNVALNRLTSFVPTFSFAVPTTNRIPGQDPSTKVTTGATTNQLTSSAPTFSFAVPATNKIPGQGPSPNFDPGAGSITPIMSNHTGPSHSESGGGGSRIEANVDNVAAFTNVGGENPEDDPVEDTSDNSNEEDFEYDFYDPLFNRPDPYVYDDSDEESLAAVMKAFSEMAFPEEADSAKDVKQAITIPIPTSSTGKTLKKFTCFPKLPIELRLKIWKICDTRTPRIFDLGSGGGLYADSTWVRGPLYNLNLESRRELMKMNPRLRIKVGDTYRDAVFFNCEADIMHFIQSSWMSVVRDFCQAEHNRKVFEKVRRVAFEYSGRSVFAHTERIMKEQYSNLPNLVEITLYLSSFYARHTSWELTAEQIAGLPDEKREFVYLHERVVREGLKEDVWRAKREPRIRVLH